MSFGTQPYNNLPNSATLLKLASRILVTSPLTSNKQFRGGKPKQVVCKIKLEFKNAFFYFFLSLSVGLPKNPYIQPN